MPKLNNLKSNNRKSRSRVGRGNGSKGTYSGRGLKGQKSRSGGGVPIFFEGGQLPLVKRLPFLRGFKNRFKKQYSLVNLSSIDSIYKSGDKVDSESLYSKGIIRKATGNIKILGDGELTKKLNFLVHAASKSAQDKIKKSGGQINFIADALNSDEKNEEEKQPDNNS